MRAKLVVAAALFLPSVLGAQGWIVPCNRPVPPIDDRPHPLPPPCRPGASIVRTASDVRVEMEGRVLRYTVEERFLNQGSVVGEADYMYPLPRGAAFQDLRLSINGELVAGETIGANEARRIYEEIVRRQRDPALVEWMGYGLLRARIFPLAPGEEKRVVVRYTVVANREGDALRVDYARGAGGTTMIEPRGDDDRGERRRSTFVLTYAPTRELGRPYSPTNELDVHDADGQRRVEVRGDGRDVTILIPVRRGDAPAIAMLPYAPGGEDGFALITVAPPSLADREPTPRDITLVLDVSGSMTGRKIEQARAAGRQLLGTLRPRDRFRLIDFSSDVRTFRDDYVSATEANIAAAQRYLDALDAQGSTNIGDALEEALRPSVSSGRLALVLFVTDGEPTVGERDPVAIARTASRLRGDRRVFTFGVGADVNASLLEQLALDGGGTPQFVRPTESVERAVGLVASRLVDPVLTDVRVRVDGDDVSLSRMHPSAGLDLFAGQDLVVLTRYRGHGAARLVVEGRRRGETVRWTSSVTLPERSRENAFVARLWAVQRIGFLSAERRRNGASSEVDGEIRQLGERFGIPTEFTSYLVQEPNTVVTRRDRAGTITGATQRGAAGSGAPAAAPSAGASFDAARQAAEQRSARSESEVDAMAKAAGGADQRTVNGHTFVLRDSVWTDTRFRPGVRTIKIKAFSAAWFAIADRLPALRAAFGLGDRVVVMVGSTAVEVSDDGVEQISDAELSQLASAGAGG